MTPPKDNNFLANIGLPFYAVAHWSPVHNAFVYANLQADLFKGEWNDYYFDTEYFTEDELLNWIEFPKIKDNNA